MPNCSFDCGKIRLLIEESVTMLHVSGVERNLKKTKFIVKWTQGRGQKSGQNTNS